MEKLKAVAEAKFKAIAAVAGIGVDQGKDELDMASSLVALAPMSRDGEDMAPEEPMKELLDTLEVAMKLGRPGFDDLVAKLLDVLRKELVPPLSPAEPLEAPRKRPRSPSRSPSLASRTASKRVGDNGDEAGPPAASSDVEKEPSGPRRRGKAAPASKQKMTGEEQREPTSPRRRSKAAPASAKENAKEKLSDPRRRSKTAASTEDDDGEEEEEVEAEKDKEEEAEEEPRKVQSRGKSAARKNDADEAAAMEEGGTGKLQASRRRSKAATKGENTSVAAPKRRKLGDEKKKVLNVAESDVEEEAPSTRSSAGATSSSQQPSRQKGKRGAPAAEAPAATAKRGKKQDAPAGAATGDGDEQGESRGLGRRRRSEKSKPGGTDSAGDGKNPSESRAKGAAREGDLEKELSEALDLPAYLESAECRVALATRGFYELRLERKVRLEEGEDVDVAEAMTKDVETWLCEALGHERGGPVDRDALSEMLLDGCECVHPGSGLAVCKSRSFVVEALGQEGVLDFDKCFPADLQGPLLVPLPGEDVASVVGAWPPPGFWKVHRAPQKSKATPNANGFVDWSCDKHPLILYVPMDAPGTVLLDVRVGSHKTTCRSLDKDLLDDQEMETATVHTVTLTKGSVVLLHVDVAYRLRYDLQAGPSSCWMAHRFVLLNKDAMQGALDGWIWRATGRAREGNKEGNPTRPGSFRCVERLGHSSTGPSAEFRRARALELKTARVIKHVAK